MGLVKDFPFLRDPAVRPNLNNAPVRSRTEGRIIAQRRRVKYSEHIMLDAAVRPVLADHR